ncbi:hypothetical protein EBS80_03475 [bacterium]|nr:hypothetical protein [bacterium]
MRQLLHAFGLMGTACLLLILAVFTFGFKNDGPIVARGAGIIGGMASRENAKEHRAYYDAGHGYMYQVESGVVTAVIAQAPSSYPFRFACGTVVPNGSSINFPQRQGDILFSAYPIQDGAGESYPTWNRLTGEYALVADLGDLGTGANADTELAAAEIEQAARIRVQNESCLTMSVAASIVAFGSFLAAGLLWAWNMVVSRTARGSRPNDS